MRSDPARKSAGVVNNYNNIVLAMLKKASAASIPGRPESEPDRRKSAALRFMKKALKRHGGAEVIVTDGLRSYPAAMGELGNLERREVRRYLNNRA